MGYLDTLKSFHDAELAQTLLETEQKLQRVNAELKAEKLKSALLEAELFEKSSKYTRLVSELAIEKQSHTQAFEKQRHLLGVEKKKTFCLEIELARQKNAKQKVEKKLG